MHEKKMNDLIYVMYNLKLKNKQIRKTVALPFDYTKSNDEWIIEDEDNVGVEPVQGKGDEGNINIFGQGLLDATQEALDLDNIVFDGNVDDAHLSSQEELDGDEDDDVGDDIIRGLARKLKIFMFLWLYELMYLV